MLHELAPLYNTQINKVEAKLLFGHILWDIGSWNHDRGVETLPSISCRREGVKSLETRGHLQINDDESMGQFKSETPNMLILKERHMTLVKR
jgi:hypothetical protein